jgi:NADH dehydrogenase
MSAPPDFRPRVLIVGGGFGGIACAKALKHADVDITLVDRNNYHCFQPLLYQVATAALSPNQIAWPIREVLRTQANITTLMAEIERIDVAAKTACASGHALPYDFLVLATGATHSYFGHDAWAPFAPGLKTIEDAQAIRRHLLTCFEQAELSDDEAERQRLLTFVIVGGGPTGVELAGAFAEVAGHALRKDFRRIDPRNARIVLIEGTPQVLPVYPADLAGYAHRELAHKSVDVRTNTMVTGCDAQGVDTSAGRIEAATIVWAAGVQSSPAANWLGAEHDRAGRVVVTPELTVPGRDEIFVIGDAASIAGKALPGIAPVAKQMGQYVARTIRARIGRRSAPAPFHYKHYGDLATIGRNSAVVKLNALKLTGFIAWGFWSVAHIYFLIGARNRIAVAFNWLWDYLTFRRGVRLILGNRDAR